MKIQLKGTKKSVKKVNENILKRYVKKEAIAYALAQSFAIKCINYFRENQSKDKYWINRTQQAFQRVFAGAYLESVAIVFFMAHAVPYGPYLELANDRKHEALRPIIKMFARKFVHELRKIY